MEPQGWLGAQGDCGLLVPSPQSEAVTHELEELTLQPTQKLPPLNERKNGEFPHTHLDTQNPNTRRCRHTRRVHWTELIDAF